LLGAKLLRGKPLYLDCDDYEAESNRFQNKWQKKIVACFEDNLPKLAEGLTVNTLFNKERNIALGFPEERIIYVPNGVDRQRFNNIEIREVERLRLEWGVEDKKIIIYVGSLSLINHPVDLLLRAFAIVSLEIPKAVLFVVGGGEDFEILKHQADALGLSDRVIFTGRIKPDEVPYYFKMADVSVDPVIDDFIARARSPLKIFESLAVGTPVVTGDVGDRRAILDGRAGILVAPGKADALAEGILTVLADGNRAKAMSESALELCEKYYWDVLVRDFVKVYY
jgi:glycosyltransferase involved in cell wall biosynthesis